MYRITKETIDKVYKPYDVITNSNGDVGFISEVSLNESQKEFDSQVDYSVVWLIGKAKNAWWSHSDLKRHTNIFVEIAKCSCNSMGDSDYWIDKIMKNTISEAR